MCGMFIKHVSNVSPPSSYDLPFEKGGVRKIRDMPPLRSSTRNSTENGIYLDQQRRQDTHSQGGCSPLWIPTDLGKTDGLAVIQTSGINTNKISYCVLKREKRDGLESRRST